MNELVKIEEKDIPAVFVENGLQPYIDAIKEEVIHHVPDLSTKSGREAIASLAGCRTRRLKRMSETQQEKETKKQRGILSTLKRLVMCNYGVN